MKLKNKYGFALKGIKKAAKETDVLPKREGRLSASYIQVSYDRTNGEVLTDYHYCLGENSWTQYRDPAVIFVCNTHQKMTMKEIAKEIERAICENGMAVSNFENEYL